MKAIEINIKKGLDLQIDGTPDFNRKKEVIPRKVALLGRDYPFLKPSFFVKEGESVKKGTPLFADKFHPEIIYTSPVSGVVDSINRGEKRRFLSIVITASGNEEITFNKYSREKIQNLSTDELKTNLLKSGMWIALRNRPYGHVAHPSDKPYAIYITATDTTPHAVDPLMVIDQYENEFNAGVEILSRLTEGKCYVVTAKESKSASCTKDNTLNVVAKGPHPSGNVGTHIHFLSPVSRTRNVWYAGYNDVIAIGHLFLTGKLLTEKVISVGGPASIEPQLVKTVSGVSLDEVVATMKQNGEVRVVSGSLLSGFKAEGEIAYLGRYHNQVSLIHEGRERFFLGWMAPGLNRFSAMRVFFSSLLPQKKYRFTTNKNGSRREMVPIGNYEKIFPFDILPVFLLRALLMKNSEWAEEMGALELEEEDLSLCTFVSVGKEDFGELLRENLTILEQEG